MELVYQLTSLNANDSFESTAPWHGSLGPWNCELANKILRATSSQEFTSDSDARSSLEPYLGAWETIAYLRDQYEIVFTNENDKAPVPDPDKIYRRFNSDYPAPNQSFTRTALVDQCLEIIRRFTSGELGLPLALGNLLAALTESAGMETFEPDYNIDPDVTATMRELASRETFRGPEWQWMQEALRLVTLQAGRRSTAPPASFLSMADFRTRL